MRFLGKMSVLAFLLSVSVWAQYVLSVRAGLIRRAEGEAYVNDARLPAARTERIMLNEGENLRTGMGRVEMQLGPGSSMYVGFWSRLQMKNAGLENMKIRMESGSIMVEIFEEYKNNSIELETGNAVIDLKKKGLYRLDCRQPMLRVYGGEAQIRQAGKKMKVKKHMAAAIGSNLKISKFDPTEKDMLHKWAGDRSYDLYFMSRLANERLKNWTPTVSGWMENEFFGMSFYSARARAEQLGLLNRRNQQQAQQEAQRQRAIQIQQQNERMENIRRQMEEQRQRQIERQLQQQPPAPPPR